MNNTNTIQPQTISNTLSGKYKILVIDKDENIIEERDWQKNLILNVGMDEVPFNLFVNLMRYAGAGTGTQQNSINGGNSTISASGTSLFLTSGGGLGDVNSFTGSYGGYSSAVSIGDIIQFSTSLQTVNVTSIDSSTQLSISPSSSISNDNFTIWKTSQTGLQNEIQRTSTMFTGIGYCGSTTVGNVVQLRRTWDFAYETGSGYSYTEVGVSWLNTVNTNMFSRILFPTAVTIANSQKLRLIYELDVTVLPVVSSPGTPLTASIVGWGTGSMVWGYENIGNYLIAGMDTNGNTMGFACLDPSSVGSSNCYIYISNNTGSVGGPGVSKAGSYVSGVGTTANSYVQGSYTLYINGNFAAGTLARSDFQTIGVTSYNSGYANASANGFSYVLTQPQSISNVQSLTLVFVTTWGRTLA